MSKKVHKILITEDDAAIASLLTELITDEGYEVLLAVDGEQGLEMAVAEKPDLILLDVMMPRKDGLTMLKELRATKEGRTMPVIMLTNQKSIEEINQSLASGVQDYFIKADWDTQGLLSSIRKKLLIS